MLNKSDKGITSVFRNSQSFFKARAAILMLFALCGLVFASWASRIPETQIELSLSYQRLGFALLGSAAGSLVALPFAGWLTTFMGSGRLTGISAFGLSILLSAIALADNFWKLTVTLFFFGVLYNCLTIAVNTQAALFEQKAKKPAMSSFHSFFSFGGMSGAIIGALMAQSKVDRLTHFLLITVSMIILTVISVPFLLQKNKSLEVTSYFPKRTIFNYKEAYLLLVVLGLIGFCGIFGEGAMADWSAVYLKQVLGTSEGLAASGYAVYSLTMAIGRLSGDILRTRIGDIRLLQVGAGLASISFAVSLISESAFISLLAFAGVGFGYSTIVPIIFSIAGKVPNISSGVAISIVTTIGYLGILSAPPLIGFLAQLFGLRGALIIIPILSFLIILISPVLKENTNID